MSGDRHNDLCNERTFSGSQMMPRQKKKHFFCLTGSQNGYIQQKLKIEALIDCNNLSCYELEKLKMVLHVKVALLSLAIVQILKIKFSLEINVLKSQNTIIFALGMLCDLCL